MPPSESRTTPRIGSRCRLLLSCRRFQGETSTKPSPESSLRRLARLRCSARRWSSIAPRGRLTSQEPRDYTSPLCLKCETGSGRCSRMRSSAYALPSYCRHVVWLFAEAGASSAAPGQGCGVVECVGPSSAHHPSSCTTNGAPAHIGGLRVEFVGGGCRFLGRTAASVRSPARWPDSLHDWDRAAIHTHWPPPPRSPRSSASDHVSCDRT